MGLEGQAQHHGKGRDFAPLTVSNQGSINVRPDPCTHADLQGEEMNEAREKFEAMLMAKGKGKPEWDGQKYDNINIQTYWRWFLLGWTMKDGK
jgi:hypothetical protein